MYHIFCSGVMCKLDCSQCELTIETLLNMELFHLSKNKISPILCDD
jgi:hypothetical protein